MKVYRIEGEFQMGRARQTFSKEYIGEDEAGACQSVYTDLGSRHGVPRRVIDIKTVTPVAAADVQDPIVRHKVA